MPFKERIQQVRLEEEEKIREEARKLEAQQKKEEESKKLLDVLVAETQRLIEQIVDVYPQMGDYRIYNEDGQVTVVWNVRARVGLESRGSGYSHAKAEVIRIEYNRFILKCDSDGSIYFSEGKQYVYGGDPKYATLTRTTSDGVFYINLGKAEDISIVMDQLEQVLAYLVYENNFGNFATAIDNRRFDDTCLDSEKFTSSELISEEEGKATFAYQHLHLPLTGRGYGKERMIFSPKEYVKIKGTRVHASTFDRGLTKDIF